MQDNQNQTNHIKSKSKVLCCYNARNLIQTEIRWICKVCGNECFKNGYGWLWQPNGVKGK